MMLYVQHLVVEALNWAIKLHVLQHSWSKEQEVSFLTAL